VRLNVTIISRHESNQFASTTYPCHLAWTLPSALERKSRATLWRGEKLDYLLCSFEVLRFLLWTSSSFPHRRNKKQLRLAGRLLDLADQTISLQICCPIIVLLVVYKHYGLHNLPFWESWPSESRQMWMSVITLNPSAMMRKPFRVVLISLLANQIRNLFYKHHIKWRTEERTHELVKYQKNNKMLLLNSEIKVLKMIKRCNVKFCNDAYCNNELLLHKNIWQRSCISICLAKSEVTIWAPAPAPSMSYSVTFTDQAQSVSMTTKTTLARHDCSICNAYGL
jgi:hypothetical protein